MEIRLIENKLEQQNKETEQLFVQDQSNIKIKEWLINSLNMSKVYGIIGKRNSGKTCLGFNLLQLHHNVGRKCYTYNFPKPYLLPNWITNLNDLNLAERGAVILLDESGIEFNQFTFGTPKSILLSNKLKIARHKDLSIIFIAQNCGNLTKDVRRLIDCYLLREPSYNQIYDEVSMIKRLYQNCFMLFSTEEQKLKGFFISELGEFAYFDKPKWFDENISKAYDGENKTVNINDLIKNRKL